MSDHKYSFVLTACTFGFVEADSYKEAVLKANNACKDWQKKLTDAGIDLRLEAEEVTRVKDG